MVSIFSRGAKKFKNQAILQILLVAAFVVAVAVVVAADNIYAVVEREDGENFVSVLGAVTFLVFAAESQEPGCHTDLELVGGLPGPVGG